MAGPGPKYKLAWVLHSHFLSKHLCMDLMPWRLLQKSFKMDKQNNNPKASNALGQHRKSTAELAFSLMACPPMRLKSVLIYDIFVLFGQTLMAELSQEHGVWGNLCSQAMTTHI